MRNWLISLSIAASAFVGVAGLAHAEDVVILQMKDGSFYNPTSGKIAPTREELLTQLGVADATSVTAITQTAVDSAIPTSTVSNEPAMPPVLAAVYRAQAELTARIKAAGEDVPQHIKPVGQNSPRDVTLAVWNEKADTIEYVDAVKDGNKLTLKSDAPADISVHASNWINSSYDIDDPNYHVVAVRYPIYNEIYKGKKVVEYEVEQAVYTPYSTHLHRPEVVAEGMRLVDQMVDGAFSDLRLRGAKSRAIPGKLVADVIDPDLIRTIAVIEHADSSGLKADARTAIERVYVTIALNPKNAYNYSKSSAGALGLFQFIPSTYASLVKNRPELGLTADFEDSMRNHDNATKAAIGYMDSILSYMPENVQTSATTEPKTLEYLAASYNGGYAKVRTAIQIWDDQISGVLTPHEILSRSRLRFETIDYVRKLRYALPAIRNLHASQPI